jgi:hypothetical protein
VSRIFNGRSGDWQNITTNLDIAGTAITAQRLDQVSSDVYGQETIINYLNRDAFALPKSGTLRNYRTKASKVRATGVSTLRGRALRILSNVRRWSFRVKTFDFFNNFNWGDPGDCVRQNHLGRITTMAGTRRIMQFGIKYDF